jgi:hypothetical protein
MYTYSKVRDHHYFCVDSLDISFSQMNLSILSFFLFWNLGRSKFIVANAMSNLTVNKEQGTVLPKFCPTMEIHQNAII